jgi:hypothetical protein
LSSWCIFDATLDYRPLYHRYESLSHRHKMKLDDHSVA